MTPMRPAFFTMQITTIKTSVVREGASLEDLIVRAVPKLSEKEIIVITSKIVSLSQGRVVANGLRRKHQWIKRESDIAIKTKWCYLTLKDGHWCPNAGVDESNADGKLILWPKNPYDVANNLRRFLRKRYKRKHVGVLITDSRTFPLRAGVTGVALGYSGFCGLRSYIGKPDIFGRPLHMTKTNVADSLATAAVLVMGEGNEQTPLARITGAPVVFTSGSPNVSELLISPKDDMYRPLFLRFSRRQFRKH